MWNLENRYQNIRIKAIGSFVRKIKEKKIQVPICLFEVPICLIEVPNYPGAEVLRALCLLTLGHISAYNMDNTILLLLLLWMSLVILENEICLKCIDNIKIGKSYSFKFKKYLISTITMNCQIFNSQTWNWPLFWQTTASTLKKNV